MTPKRLRQLLALHRDNLLDETMPFWMNHAIDRKCGGYLHCLDHDGSVVQLRQVGLDTGAASPG